ncbi:MAG TPA: GNAT family N-acetyltransferase [Thermoleophilaceae bacterium]
MQLVAADSISLSALAALFNEGFSDYLVPMRLSESQFRDHLQNNDIDLSCSRVLVEDEPVAFSLVGLRAEEAWIGGMGTVPARRRRALGERALVASMDAASERGASGVWLEVIDRNEPALRLYEKLGFELVRDLVVWSLTAPQDEPPRSREVEPEEARAWIAAHRQSREPWQRSDAALRHMDGLRALMVESGAAVIYKRADSTTITMQITAGDEEAASEALLAAAAGGGALRLSNAPAGEPASRALERLGAEQQVWQHEMRLAL